jgi:hypothetical protein
MNLKDKAKSNSAGKVDGTYHVLSAIAIIG